MPSVLTQIFSGQMERSQYSYRTGQHTSRTYDLNLLTTLLYLLLIFNVWPLLKDSETQHEQQEQLKSTWCNIV